MVDKREDKRRVIDAEEPAPVALDIDPAAVEFIIFKARAFSGKVPPVEPDPGSNPGDDDERGIIEDYPSDQTETELRDAIEQISEDAAIDLLAIYWLGRGDFAPDEWQDARTLAIERARADISSYLMGDPELGDFLEEGLIDLGYTPQEFGPS